jgi:hypothetical protein
MREMDFTAFGRTLILFGLFIIVLGGLILLGNKLPWLGRLPGDFLIRRQNFTIYFPIATSFLISLLLTLILWFFTRR